MKKIITLFLSLMLSLLAKDAKLELGLGIASLYYPNYIGSNSTQIITVPLPYIRYRGDYFRIDKDGLSGKLFGIDDLNLDLSVSGSLPSNSAKDTIRAGMPNLDLTGEIGFKFVYNIFEQGVSQLEFEFPIRAVLSTDFSNIKYQGIVSNPQLKYSLNYSKLEWTFRSGIILGDKKYNNYYYGVKEKYVTPEREYYHAKGGFNGFRNRIGMSYKKGVWWAGAFVSYFNIKNGVIANSPLVVTNNAVYSGVSIAYIFYSEP